MKIKHILIIPFICIAFTGCEDNNPITPTQNTPNQEQLPPITTTGAGTFGCKINGKVWVANSNTSWPHIYFAFNKANNSIILSGNLIQKPVDDLKVNLRFPYITDSTIYCIGFNPNPVPSGGGYIDVEKNLFWRTDSLRGGEVNLLRFDSVSQIISGTFYFDCINQETGETLKITDGRFDGYFTY